MKRLATVIIAAGLLLGAAAPAAWAASLTSQVSATSVQAGGSVTVNGTYAANAWVSLRVLDSTNSVVVFDAAKSDANGAYSFTFVVPASAALGNLTVLTGSGADVASKTVTLTQTSTGGGVIIGPGTGSGNTTIEDGKIEIKPEVTKGADGRTEAKATINETQLSEALKESPDKVTITVTGDSTDQVVAQLDAKALQLAAKNNTVIEIKSEIGIYTLPTSVLDLEAIAKDLGVPVEQLSLNIKLVQATQDQKQAVGAETKELGATSVAPVIEFVIEFTAPGGKSAEVSSFGTTYVSRSLELTDSSIDPAHTTGVRYDPVTGVFRFVPTVFQQADGKWIATLKRNGNSLYTVIENEKTFTDVASHWAKKEVEQLASKLIVQGVSNTSFSPDGSVTRAEFTALIVRALGLDEAKGSSAFSDVTSGAWYANTVATAYNAKLVSGYEDGTFRPNQPITRQELAVLMDNAMAYVGKRNASLNVDTALNTFQDRGTIAAWAKSAVAQIVSAGITNGKADGAFVADSNATRAEATVMIQRLLKLAVFIN
ncbi:S-layer homology domain-containing protein [Paenibacillus koleovorans]|uniref:S-layer homology domain-containing protein n=1 Tax=Paenibacillus koleovorans TaxID=121608 RepID=UPI000FDAAEC7|nr:S-layer homology domain-containing protein [Paenibacillus koleovorans]